MFRNELRRCANNSSCRRNGDEKFDIGVQPILLKSTELDERPFEWDFRRVINRKTSSRIDVIAAGVQCPHGNQ